MSEQDDGNIFTLRADTKTIDFDMHGSTFDVR